MTQPDPAVAVTADHQPRPKTLGLSGRHYVPMRLRSDNPYEPIVPVKILTAVRCAHIETVCASCVQTWAIDWSVLLFRTAGGRGLAAAAGHLTGVL